MFKELVALQSKPVTLGLVEYCLPTMKHGQCHNYMTLNLILSTLDLTVKAKQKTVLIYMC